MRELREIRVRFERDGDLEVSVTYSHQAQIANPGTTTRTTTAAKMASGGLRRALEALDRGPASLAWGGFATDTHITSDRLLVDRREDAA